MLATFAFASLSSGAHCTATPDGVHLVHVVHIVHAKLVFPYPSGYGYTLTEGQPIEFPCEIPSPFGGEALAAVETAELRDDPATPAVEYGYTRVIGPEALEGLVKRVYAAAGIEGEEFEEAMAEEMEHAQLTSKLEWAYEDGLVRSGRSESVWRVRHSGDVLRRCGGRQSGLRARGEMVEASEAMTTGVAEPTCWSGARED